MKNTKDYFTLINNVKMPCIGLGTYKTADGEQAVSTILKAIECGYRHIDTASFYGNEESIGIAIEKSQVKREELFITSKLWNNDHGYESTISAFNKTLQKLKLDYLDLYLIHWPVPIAFRNTWGQTNALTWKAMEELYQAGKIKAIGLSNFKPHHIDALLETAKIKPMINQIELHPGEIQKDTVDFCETNGILLQAYSPLGRAKLANVPVMKELEQKYNKSFAQICIRWCIQHGFVPLPKSTTPQRIKENTEIFDFVISDKDIKKLDKITYEGCKCKDSDNIDF